MSEYNENIFAVLERNHVVLPSHIQVIFDELGFKCLRSIAALQMEDLAEIEDNVTKVLAEESKYERMDAEQKIRLLGKNYANTPSKFKFLAGEKKRFKLLSTSVMSLSTVAQYQWRLRQKQIGSDLFRPLDLHHHLFKTENKKDFLMGRILSFARKNKKQCGRSKKIWEWQPEGCVTRASTSTYQRQPSQIEEINEEIEALCLWYHVAKGKSVTDVTGQLTQAKVVVHGFYDCKYYLCSVPSPVYCDGSLTISTEVIEQLSLFFESYSFPDL